MYTNTHLFIQKDIKITWKDITNTFSGTFKENMDDWQVYVNIHKLGLFKVACRFPVFPCVYMIPWIVSHADPKTMVLSSVNGEIFSSFWMEHYHGIHHFIFPVRTMDALSYTPMTTWTQEKSWIIGKRSQQYPWWHPTRCTWWRQWGRHTSSWSSLYVTCMAKGEHRPSHRVWALC